MLKPKIATVNCKEHKTNKVMLEWDYKQYPSKDSHIYSEDHQGINTFKVGNKNISEVNFYLFSS